jgi:hypothetical protein
MSVKIKRRIIWVLNCFVMLFIHVDLNGQEMPPRPVSVYLEQNLRFGALSVGISGGTVTVTHYGTRSATGDIVLVNFGFSCTQAIFEIEGERGAIIHILPVSDALLIGNNGGTMTAQINDFQPGDPVILTEQFPGRTQVNLGGVLIVGNLLANPLGDYTGTFQVTFAQE